MTKTPKYHLHHGEGGAAITVHVVRKAGQNSLARVDEDGTVHVRMAAGGNPELLAFLAGVLQVSVRQLEIVGGEHGDDKLITILNLDSAQVQDRILAAL